MKYDDYISAWGSAEGFMLGVRFKKLVKGLSGVMGVIFGPVEERGNRRFIRKSWNRYREMECSLGVRGHFAGSGNASISYAGRPLVSKLNQ